MPWIRYGQDVSFTTPAVPGRKFKGKVLFLDPVLDMKTRTVKIRVEAENPEYILRPGMFVTAELEAEIDAKGRVIKPEWAGKYICPIHPSDHPSSEPGFCPESKMALRPASAFGYGDDPNPEFPLVIPTAAPLITGKRTIVYVEVPKQDRPTYELREVVLGPRAGEEYVVYQGLKEGERVVTKGNFKIDSAMQIVAKASMMNPIEPKPAKGTGEKAEDEVVKKLQAPDEFVSSLTPMIQEYLNLKESLVGEKSEEAAVFCRKAGRAAEGGQQQRTRRQGSGNLEEALRLYGDQLEGDRGHPRDRGHAQGLRSSFRGLCQGDDGISPRNEGPSFLVPLSNGFQ